MAETRIERDSMGEMVVPANAYYGAQTARAVENFPISGLRFPRSFIRALGTMTLGPDVVYLDLAAGANELIFAVRESFGGWGLAAKLLD